MRTNTYQQHVEQCNYKQRSHSLTQGMSALRLAQIIDEGDHKYERSNSSMRQHRSLQISFKQSRRYVAQKHYCHPSCRLHDANGSEVRVTLLLGAHQGREPISCYDAGDNRLKAKRKWMNNEEKMNKTTIDNMNRENEGVFYLSFLNNECSIHPVRLV